MAWEEKKDENCDNVACNPVVTILIKWTEVNSSTSQNGNLENLEKGEFGFDTVPGETES